MAIECFKKMKKIKKMKKLIYLISALLLIISCDDNIIGDFEEDLSIVVDDRVNKKGNAYSYRAPRWSHKTSEIAPNWFYHWGLNEREEIPSGVEHVPMFWGKGSVNDEEIEKIIALKNEGKINYILAFNEPDGFDQSNVSVDEAIALWPKLEAIGLPLVSPAVKGPGYKNNWLIQFMQRAEELNYRVDYIGFHHYPGPNATNFINDLRKTYEMFNKPIWITEFAVADWNATTDANNRHSEAKVLQFMQDVLPALDEIEWIERYAWFDDGDASRPQLASSRLFDADGNITAVGQYYAAHKPNPNVGPGSDTEYIPPADDDELINNGHFEGGTFEKVLSWGSWDMPNSWDGYQSSVAYFEVTEANTGFYSARLLNGSSGMETVVSVEPGKTYVYKLYSKWAEENTFKMRVVFKDHIANKKITTSDLLPNATEWTETTGEITIPSGVTELRMVFWNDKQKHFYFDDVSLKEKI